jgi:AraC-like DNA-binding protein
MDTLKLLEKIVPAYGVKLLYYTETAENLKRFDDGLRNRLFEKYDLSLLSDYLRTIQAGTIHFIKDGYKCWYCAFFIPSAPEALPRYCIIGPWIEDRPSVDEVEGLLQKRGIPPQLKPELLSYLYGIPLILNSRSWKVVLIKFAETLYGTENIRLCYKNFEPCGSMDEYNTRAEEALSMHIIEERYKILDAMLEAVGRGDTKQALEFLVRFGNYKRHPVAPDPLRDNKNYSIMLNSSAQKAVIGGCVHPAYIDAVFLGFAGRIEASTSLKELHYLAETMIRSYCDLVQKYSLRNYSPLIRKVINIIDFNLQENLSLRFLARQCNVNASYLSAQFKREKNTTITAYINAKRLKQARAFLGTSDLNIQDVACSCGFFDVNYFSRLFKREYGQTPREYKKFAHSLTGVSGGSPY